MVYFWRCDQRTILVPGGSSLVHFHCGHSRRTPVFQDCRADIFPLWEGSHLRRRSGIFAFKCLLDYLIRSAPGAGTSGVRGNPLCDYRGNSLRSAAVQAGKAGVDALRRGGRLDRRVFTSNSNWHYDVAFGIFFG